MKRLVLCCLLSSCGLLALAQPTPLAWINAHAQPLRSVAEANATDNDKDLAFLARTLRGTTLCGLGEASHGTHEFYLTKLRLVRYLVTHLHYQHLGLEYEAGAIEQLNAYVQTGQGDARALLRPLHLYATEELYQLVQWVAAYNQTQALDNRVTLFGFDTNYTPAYQAAAAAICLAYVQQHPAQVPVATAAEPVLTKIKTSSTSALFELADAEVAALHQATAAVQAVPSGGSDAAFQRFAQQLTLLDEGTRLGDPLARDPFMADNIVAYQSLHPGNTMLWGHNVHLAKDTTMTNYRGTGYYLRRHYGAGYYALGFDTYQGQVNVLAKGEFATESFTAQPTSFSALLAQAKYPVFFLPLPATSPLGTGIRLITHINSNWSKQRELPMRPGVDFDGLVFVRQTTASIPLK
ncbi:erythromycin esterase family protein [Hymenobacter sp. BT559]|uniref:erythromycin esterase family protein n=1 Tax=Hymenobacter sp. BT559 TaxID=2795729 RepID=UPI0018ECAE5B|nr:erythromycin esterase family protein [Hymenobacter sp. BT559]MBJ6145162.1 erythromycin esterase family protein [Hymenobacter sp. BT559]